MTFVSDRRRLTGNFFEELMSAAAEVFYCGEILCCDTDTLAHMPAIGASETPRSTFPIDTVT